MKTSFLPSCLRLLVVAMFFVSPFGCESTGQSNNSSQDPPAEEVYLRMQCHYQLGEKYAIDQNADSLQRWRVRLEKNAKSSPPGELPYDLFTHQGGGPMGAEWNSDGGLFLIAESNMKPRDILGIELLLNGVHHESQDVLSMRLDPKDPKGTRFEAVIPADAWLGLLRPIEAADHPLIYSQEDIEAMKDEPNSPLGVGEIMVLTLRVEYLGSTSKEEIEASGAFHLARGE